MSILDMIASLFGKKQKTEVPPHIDCTVRLMVQAEKPVKDEPVVLDMKSVLNDGVGLGCPGIGGGGGGGDSSNTRLMTVESTAGSVRKSAKKKRHSKNGVINNIVTRMRTMNAGESRIYSLRGSNVDHGIAQSRICGHACNCFGSGNYNTHLMSDGRIRITRLA